MLAGWWQRSYKASLCDQGAGIEAGCGGSSGWFCGHITSNAYCKCQVNFLKFQLISESFEWADFQGQNPH